jgi:hypothetical protein
LTLAGKRVRVSPWEKRKKERRRCPHDPTREARKSEDEARAKMSLIELAEYLKNVSKTAA